MQLASLGPNISLLKSPSNWFLVAFTLALLILICHLLFNKEKA